MTGRGFLPARDRAADVTSRHGAWLLAIGLFATSMLAASTFKAAPGTSAPGPSPSFGGVAPGGPASAYQGPKLQGVFVNCSPACDLIVAREGAGLRLTFTDRAVDESAPALSPDGEDVVFRCGAPAIEPGGAESPQPAGLGSICMVSTLVPEVDGATPLPVNTFLSTPDVDYGSPAWSPDGRSIAFDFRDLRAGGAGTTGVGIWDLADGRPTTITDPGTDASDPAWSPDGASIAFKCGSLALPSGGTAQRFCTMAKDGSDIVQLGGPDGHCGAPTYAPDAVHLGVVCVVPGAAGGDLFFLALSEPATHSLTGDQRIAPEGEKDVAFSPDGRFVYLRRGDSLWALDPSTETWSLPPLPPLHGDFDVRVLR